MRDAFPLAHFLIDKGNHNRDHHLPRLVAWKEDHAAHTFINVDATPLGIRARQTLTLSLETTMGLGLVVLRIPLWMRAFQRLSFMHRLGVLNWFGIEISTIYVAFTF